MSHIREIERKFLVQNDDWKEHACASIKMTQMYFADQSQPSIRIRIEGLNARINMKFITDQNRLDQREEFEYELPLDEAKKIIELAQQPVVEKTRWPVMHAGKFWEVDVFSGSNAGLVTAEIELKTADEYFLKPSWLGKEVTHEVKYYNTQLAYKPYAGWT